MKVMPRTEIVEDPLNPSREVYDKEEVSRVKISLQNAEFSVRYSHSAEIQMVKIEKISTNGKQLVSLKGYNHEKNLIITFYRELLFCSGF
ncbi:hypothetical protein ATE47_13870 [Chryseobacterium sp. IHB B 17019]|uniref:hypothetical protein n=1 Tax=Chryseobacterium sp. IHB B 17019 TaxID=1721091 RepID=UPI00071EE9C0|nr:hypothetical protein [Chryseobacterium sp. IHB B 17019]ALR31536.1 hypothetical protein ATE47_13870 [Chryseobacterium sp. IHB B 17019]